MKELRILKTCLQERSEAVNPPVVSDKETLASLLHLQCRTEDVNLISLAISYHLNVMRLIVNSGRAATVEASVDHLVLDNHLSPASLILRSAELTSDKSKAAKQLDSLSRLILAMCPSPSTSADQSVNVTPYPVFRLQTTALAIQTKWWRLAGHKPDLEKELHEPLARYTDAYHRRAQSHGAEDYELAIRCVGQLVPLNDDGNAIALPFVICKSLSLLSETFGMYDEALRFNDALSSTSKQAPTHGLRSVISTLRFLALKAEHYDTSDVQIFRHRMKSCKSDLQAISKQGPILFDDFLVELAKLRKTVLKLLTNESEKGKNGDTDKPPTVLCELALFCTDLLLWHTRLGPEDVVQESIAPKLVVAFISSSLFTCKILVSHSLDQLDMIRNGLETSVALVDLYKDIPEVQQLPVTISNLYWRCFQLLASKPEEMSSQAVQFLRASVAVLQDRASKHQEAGFLAMKLEKLGKVADSCSSFTDSIRVQLRSGILRELVQDAASRPLSSILDARSKTQLLRRHLIEYHAACMNQSGHTLFYDDDTLEPVERATLLEAQMCLFEEDFFKPSRRRKIIPDLQTLCGHLLELYESSEYPIRRARICVRMLKYSREYRDLLNAGIIKKALACKLTPDALGSDIDLAPYLPHAEASLIIAQKTHEDKSSVDSIMDSFENLFTLATSTTTWETLKSKIDDLDVLRADIQFAASYLAMKGRDNVTVKAFEALVHIHRIRPDHDPSSTLQSMSQLALLYQHMGYSSEACRVLEDEEHLASQVSATSLSKIEWHLVKVETLVHLGKSDLATKHIMSASEALRSLPTVNDTMKVQAQLVRAYFSYACSLYSTTMGHSKQSIIHAKRYVALCQQTLAFLERQHAPQNEVRGSDSQEELTKAIDSLAIVEVDSVPDSVSSPAKQSNEIHGAACSAIVPDLLKSFLHLSELYAHQGLRAEASYYLEQADKLVTRLDVPDLRTKILVQKEAQAYIEGIVTVEPASESNPLDSIESVKLGIIRGDIYANLEDNWENARLEYEKAESMAARLSSKSFAQKVQELKAQSDGITSAKGASARNAKRAVTKVPPSTVRPTKALKSASLKTKAITSEAASDKENIPLASLCAAALRQRGLLLLNQGETDLGMELLKRAEITKYDPVQQTLQQTAMAEALLRKFGDELALDFTFNVLPESTISFPALSAPSGKKLQAQNSLMSTPLSGTSGTTPKKTSRQKRADDEFTRCLLEAQERIMSVQHRSASTASMSVFHQICGLGSKAMLLLSAISNDASLSTVLHPTRAACSIELPRIEALTRELNTVEAERDFLNQDLAVEFQGQGASHHLSASRFQKEYIDIIPSTWTAVSLTLNEDHSELYIVRYRAKQAPFLLRLPMTRNKMQDLEEDEESAAFDFESGKAELQEIIELSNYSCSKPPSTMTKETKQSWWAEREALDLRMQELLLNIENIWLGGFKGVLSQHRKDSGLLARFRKSFEGILDRHLPSRQGTKGKGKKLVLDANILELFVGLGDDHDGEVDMDEQVLDLLYFVIDVLQFNGERNAYDEVDFDVMATETMDALRSYHEAAIANDAEQNHLILILDRKLHAFPWESMPCLQSVSVSRVGSMLTLRERILAMREQLSFTDSEKYHVPRTSGTTILNPSGDLSRTQATLSPHLDPLATASDSTWRSISNRAPSESDFSTALSETDILLYFGHGSGNQYIRNRTIKKLQKCSSVVWLMGCSSGLVTEHGDFEPTSVPLSYLVSGSRDEDSREETSDARKGLCLAVVATLWDVTDKDIDRFSISVGKQWSLFSLPNPNSTTTSTITPSLQPKTPRKRGRQMPKTPSKTPCRTPATANRSRSRMVMKDEDGDEDRKKSLVEAVACSREVCTLRYLNGAATVVYGVPVYLGD